MAPQKGQEYVFRMSAKNSSFVQEYPQIAAEITDYVNASLPIKDETAYNTFIHGITDIIGKHTQALAIPTPLYEKELGPIQRKNEITFPVVWGGVSFKYVDVEKDQIRKLLVVGARGILGFEYHNEKHEELTVKEGYAIIIGSVHGSEGWKEGAVTLTFAGPGDHFVLEPGDEHGVIAITNTVLEEESNNRLEDLIFIYNSQPAT